MREKIENMAASFFLRPSGHATGRVCRLVSAQRLPPTAPPQQMPAAPPKRNQGRHEWRVGPRRSTTGRAGLRPSPTPSARKVRVHRKIKKYPDETHANRPTRTVERLAQHLGAKRTTCRSPAAMRDRRKRPRGTHAPPARRRFRRADWRTAGTNCWSATAGLTCIRLTKLSGRRGATIPVGSTVTGLATAWPEPEIRVPYLLRHGPLSASWLDQCDWFYTTTVLRIRRYKDHRILTTKNSRWRLELGILSDDTPRIICN